MMTPHQQLVEHIAANGGILHGEPAIDGKWHNIPAEEGRKGNKSFAYIAFQNADGSIGGKIKNYYRDDDGESFIFTAEKTAHSSPQRPPLQTAERQQRQAVQEQEQHAAQMRAAQKAQYVYGKLSPAPADHPYLARKGILPHMAKVNESGMLVIPMINEAGKIQSIEFIGDGGFKKIMAGTSAAGAFAPIGFPRDSRPEQILIAEGFATAASLHETTGIPAVHARGKGNMERALDIMQRRHPQAQIIIAADNDQDKEINAGMNTARNIQDKYPEVPIMRPPIAGDYNDLAVMPDGKDTIRQQFADIDRNQYITESRAEKLLSNGQYDLLLHAARSGNIDLTPALSQKMIEAGNPTFSREIMRLSLNDASPQVREAAAIKLAQGNDGAPVPSYRDISMADVETIRHDASDYARFAAIQTDLDKAGIDLPDNIMAAITSWQKEVANRQQELGLSNEQVKKLTQMLTERIIAHRDKPINLPKNKEREQQKEYQHEP